MKETRGPYLCPLHSHQPNQCPDWAPALSASAAGIIKNKNKSDSVCEHAKANESSAEKMSL